MQLSIEAVRGVIINKSSADGVGGVEVTERAKHRMNRNCRISGRNSAVRKSRKRKR